jgi:hypothetical protein
LDKAGELVDVHGQLLDVAGDALLQERQLLDHLLKVRARQYELHTKGKRQ